MSAPKAFSALCFDGVIRWFYPGEHETDRAMERWRKEKFSRRSRMETDDEVKARIKRHRPEVWALMNGDERGHKLDQVLKGFGLEPRKAVDDV